MEAAQILASVVVGSGYFGNVVLMLAKWLGSWTLVGYSLVIVGIMH